jgi:glutaredoxin
MPIRLTSCAAQRLALAVVLAGLALPAAALYKVVLPDGSVIYTDRPPGDAAARVSPLGRGTVRDPATPQDTLPQELRQVAARFPVTLYSAADCAPCDAGRKLLLQRGVPFTEKLVVSDDDAVTIERMFGTRNVPALTIGAQALVGLSQGEWMSYLDIAGYPRGSKLPKGWQPPAATPLVARSSPPIAPAAASAPAPIAPAPATAPPPAPGGIRF